MRGIHRLGYLPHNGPVTRSITSSWYTCFILLSHIKMSRVHYTCELYLPLFSRMVSMGLFDRYVKRWFAHVPGMPRTFFSSLQVSDPDMHHGTWLMHVPWCMPGSLFSLFLWRLWRGKRSRYSRRMRNPQLYVSSKRPMGLEHLYE